MTHEMIWNRLTGVFRDVFGDEGIVFTAETTASDVEEWDSMSNVQLLIAVEQEFTGVKFSTGEIANLKNVGELVDVIKRKTA